jgi:TonB family protein
MKALFIVGPLFAAAAQQVSAAECIASTNVAATSLSSEKQAVRSAIYLELCRRSDGNLIDGDDVATRERLTFPKRRMRQTVTLGSDPIYKIQKAKASVVLAYVIETTGKVSWVSVLESSGDKEIDAAAFSLTKAIDLGDAITQGGEPVRVFRTVTQMSQFASPTP